MITFKEFLAEDWQRAKLRKHGSVKPGHWNGQKFVTDLANKDKPGFDHERCKSINAQIEVNGKVVAGGLRVDESITEGRVSKLQPNTSSKDDV